LECRSTRYPQPLEQPPRLAAARAEPALRENALPLELAASSRPTQLVPQALQPVPRPLPARALPALRWRPVPPGAWPQSAAPDS
jgi:hypothetical protein